MDSEKEIVELRKLLRGKILRDEPLAKHSSFGIGGKADYFFTPLDEEDLRTLLTMTKESQIRLKVIGNGTNILFRDGGFRGMIVSLPFRQWSIHRDIVTAGSSSPLATLITRTVEEGLGGLEPLSGIPGTVGGAIITNAGTFAGDVSNAFLSLKGFDLEGNPIVFGKEEVNFSYRKAILPRPLLITEVSFQMKKRDPRECEKIVKDLLRRRRETQPTQKKNVGCIFKNPDGDYAGKIIDELGLKGTRFGNAEISRIHGNFIVNLRGATSRDVTELIRIVREKVQRERGISLELEVEIVGEDVERFEIED